MRFSINTVLFVSPFRTQDARLFKRFKQWGFEAVELLVEAPAHIDPVRVKRELDKQGLACGSVCAAMNKSRDLRGSRSSHFARTTFCWLPPDNSPTARSTVDVRTRNRAVSSDARARSRRPCIQPKRENWPIDASVVFSRIVIRRMRP